MDEGSMKNKNEKSQGNEREHKRKARNCMMREETEGSRNENRKKGAIKIDEGYLKMASKQDRVGQTHPLLQHDVEIVSIAREQQGLLALRTRV